MQILSSFLKTSTVISQVCWVWESSPISISTYEDHLRRTGAFV